MMYSTPQRSMKPVVSKAAPIQAANTPTAVRPLYRTMFRITIRQPKLKHLHKPVKCSSQTRPPATGGLGRIASAGLSCNADRVPRQQPSKQHARLITSEMTYKLGYTTLSKCGNSKN